MFESARMWMEIPFSVAYLGVVWTLVILMWRHQSRVPPSDAPIGRLFLVAFGLLALGDSGHLGFRLWAHALGDFDAQISLFGLEMGMVGVGALETAITVTVFYVCIQMIWHRRFRNPYGWFGALLFGTVLVRFALMIPAANEWTAPVPPQPWSIYRNLPLIVQGLGVAYLILRDASASKDKAFMRIGLLILASYAFYIPVVFFVQRMPALGMLMIPKTIAYVAIGFVGYFEFFRRHVGSTESHLLKLV